MRAAPAVASLCLVVLTASVARADDRPRMLVLPLPATPAVDADTARAFDARLLVALEDTNKVVAVTASDEPECTTMDCLAELGIANDAALVLSLTVVEENDALTVFGTVVDSKTAAPWRRVELDGVTAKMLARRAPAQLAPQIVGARARATVVGLAAPSKGVGMTAGQAIIDRLSGYKTFAIVPIDSVDRAELTHRAEVTITRMAVVENFRRLCTWLDGTLVATFAITDLATGRTVFTSTVNITKSRRTWWWTTDEVTDLLAEQAIYDWMVAFRDGTIEPKLRRRTR